ncbi:ComEA family DNA-binding protein [Sporichthya polymorpha]|uniref:ComEA family DNA-binding protein n=1 Tax=Sporichthya polymorpha TaxID=35751 RepID=UPI000377690A|nr:ComEA family DNA-binding protein [Sporichthya polymorpha]
MGLRAGSGRVAEARARAELRLRDLFAVGPGPVAVDAADPDSADSDPADDGSAIGRVRIGLDRRAVGALLVIALGGVVIAGAVVLRSRPHVEDVGPAALVAPGSPVPGVSAAPGLAPPSIVVDVQGKVRRPGVVQLPAGSRVLDALTAAGGPRPGVGTTSLNLAQLLTDGEQIVLDPGGAGGAAGIGSDGLVNLNTATLADLDSLPGVGPVLAQRILDWRSEHGRFSSVEELQEVPGIGPSTFADLKDRVRV